MYYRVSPIIIGQNPSLPDILLRRFPLQKQSFFMDVLVLNYRILIPPPLNCCAQNTGVQTSVKETRLMSPVTPPIQVAPRAPVKPPVDPHDMSARLVSFPRNVIGISQKMYRASQEFCMKMISSGSETKQIYCITALLLLNGSLTCLLCTDSGIRKQRIVRARTHPCLPRKRAEPHVGLELRDRHNHIRYRRRLLSGPLPRGQGERCSAHTSISSPCFAH